MKRLVITAISVFCVGASAAHAADLTPDQTEQVKIKSGKWLEKGQEADKLAKAAKYSEAETIYKQILTDRENLNLDLFPAYESLGALYTQWGKKQQAEETYKAMVAAREKLNGPNESQVVYPLQEYAKSLENNGKKHEALAAKARAAAIQKDVESLPKFGKITIAVGSPERLAEAEKMRAIGEKLITSDLQDKALLYFERAVQLNPDDAKAICDRGEMEIWRDQEAKALLDFNKAIKLKADLAKAYLDRAMLFENRKQYPKAIADFDKAIAIDAKDTETMGLRAKLLDENGKHKEAIFGYTKIIASNPALYWPYIQRASSYEALGDYKSAVGDYTIIITRSPDDTDYHEYRAEAYAKMGDFKNAVTDYDKMIETNPKYSIVYHKRAQVYEKIDGKKTARVIADYAMAKKLGYSN